MEIFRYEIRVEGGLNGAWRDWYEGLDFREDGDQTIITLTGRDLALLHGVLSQIGNMNIQLVSVQRTGIVNEITDASLPDDRC